MFSNKLIALLTLPTLLFLYLAWKVDERYASWLIPFLVMAAVVYILKNEIDWWWYAKHPPVMAPPLVAILERYCPFYQQLDEEGRATFRSRTELFKMGTEWMPMAWPDDELPEDVKTAIAAAAVMVGFGQSKFLFEKFEKVIVYPCPFPTEKYHHAHASELYAPDGCILFSAEQVMWAFMQPARWYNVAVHEYAKAFVLTYPQHIWPEKGGRQVDWSLLEQVSAMDKTHTEAVLGMPVTDFLPVMLHHYFIFPVKFGEVFPKEKVQFDAIFNAAANKRRFL